MRVGVISTDLGEEAGSLPSCRGRGDGGKLLNVGGNASPTPTFVTVVDKDPATRHNAESSLRKLRIGSGCGYERPLEALYLALNPRLQLNPGFLRPGAMLAGSNIATLSSVSPQSPKCPSPQ